MTEGFSYTASWSISASELVGASRLDLVGAVERQLEEQLARHWDRVVAGLLGEAPLVQKPAIPPWRPLTPYWARVANVEARGESVTSLDELLPGASQAARVSRSWGWTPRPLTLWERLDDNG